MDEFLFESAHGEEFLFGHGQRFWLRSSFGETFFHALRTFVKGLGIRNIRKIFGPGRARREFADEF